MTTKTIGAQVFWVGQRGEIVENKNKMERQKNKCLRYTKAVLEYLVWLTRATTISIGAQVVWVEQRGKIGENKEKMKDHRPCVYVQPKQSWNTLSG